MFMKEQTYAINKHNDEELVSETIRLKWGRRTYFKKDVKYPLGIVDEAIMGILVARKIQHGPDLK